MVPLVACLCVLECVFLLLGTGLTLPGSRGGLFGLLSGGLDSVQPTNAAFSA